MSYVILTSLSKYLKQRTTNPFISSIESLSSNSVTVLNIRLTQNWDMSMSKKGVFSGPYFPAFGLNTERYGVSLRI